jgi:hypothetical protein
VIRCWSRQSGGGGWIQNARDSWRAGQRWFHRIVLRKQTPSTQLSRDERFSTVGILGAADAVTDASIFTANQDAALLVDRNVKKV